MGMGIPQEDADRIVRLYTEEHCYYDKIATATGYSKDEIRRCLYDRGVLLSHSHLGNPLPYDVLYDEYVTQGKSANRIAEEHGVTKATVLKWLRILEIPVRTPPNASGVNIDTDTLRQAYVYEHRDVKGLAQQAHCSAEALSRHIKRLGLDIERQEHRDSIIREGIQNGHSPLRISNDSGIPYGHVRKRCKELRLTTPSQRSMERAASLDRERAVSLYTDEGKSAQQIAEQLQVPYSAVYRVLREEHVEMRPSHQHAAVDVGKLSKRYLEDRAGYAELTAEFGISPIALNRILRANGIALRRDVRHAEKWDDDTFPEFIRWACEVNGNRLTVPEVADYFDVTEAAVRHKAHALGLESCFCQHCSAPELHWMRWLDSQGLSYENNARTVISPQEIDLYLPEFRLGLEINPTCTHSVDIQAFGDQSRQMTIGYHQAKSRRAEEAGVRLIHVFDWDDESKIRDLVLNACRRNEVVYARNTTVRPVSKQDEAWFMRQNHLHGHVPSVCCYGLYGGDGRLLMAMSFGRPRYDNVERAEWELLRLCAVRGTRVVGGASKLFAHFVREHNPRKIMSLCDYGISRGDVYERMGFSFVRLTQPSYQWVNPADPSEHYSWNLINSKGFDNVFGTDYGKGVSNAELMREGGYVRVYNAGNKVYVWESEPSAEPKRDLSDRAGSD